MIPGSSSSGAPTMMSILWLSFSSSAPHRPAGAQRDVADDVLQLVAAEAQFRENDQFAAVADGLGDLAA